MLSMRKLIYTYALHTRCPIRVQFGVRNLHRTQVGIF